MRTQQHDVLQTARRLRHAPQLFRVVAHWFAFVAKQPNDRHGAGDMDHIAQLRRSLIAAAGLEALATAHMPTLARTSGKPFTVSVIVLPGGPTLVPATTSRPARSANTALSPAQKQRLQTSTPPPEVRITY